MRDVLFLLKRDFKNSFSIRLLVILVFLLLFQVWFILGSNSVGQVRSTGEMHYMAVVFSFNIFGSIAALALTHDGISIERESKFLDLILTSGVSKMKVYLSKVLASVLISGFFALSYITVLMLVYLAMSGDIGLSLLTMRYVLPLTAFLSVFSLMGLMLSIVFRSSRASLITSVIIGALLMPRLFIMIIDSLSGIFRFGEKATEMIYMISPALIMNALSGYSEMTYILWSLLLLVIYLASLILLGIRVFMRQDELNYGE